MPVERMYATAVSAPFAINPSSGSASRASVLSKSKIRPLHQPARPHPRRLTGKEILRIHTDCCSTYSLCPIPAPISVHRAFKLVFVN